MAAVAQPDEDKLGAWYMYFWNLKLNNSQFGFQGDYQLRNWNIAGDLEQILLRSGFYYQPKGTSLLLTLGYGYISSGAYGESSAKVAENRIYQEALLPQKVGERVFLTHRFRYEQRWVENQDLRTRFRYNLFINVPLNQPDLKQGSIYLALYNEIFINGQRDIGNDRTVEIFDRNRAYGALGYGISDKLRVQAGIMQQATDSWEKAQLQFSLHHTL